MFEQFAVARRLKCLMSMEEFIGGGSMYEQEASRILIRKAVEA